MNLQLNIFLLNMEFSIYSIEIYIYTHIYIYIYIYIFCTHGVLNIIYGIGNYLFIFKIFIYLLTGNIDMLVKLVC